VLRRFLSASALFGTKQRHLAVPLCPLLPHYSLPRSSRAPLLKCDRCSSAPLQRCHETRARRRRAMAPSHALLLALLATPLDSFYHPVCTRVPLALRAQQQRQQRPKRLHKRREPEREPERRSWNPQAIKLNRQIANRDGSHEDIFRLFNTRKKDFSEVNYATALNWLAKKQPRGGYAVDSQDARNLAELILAASKQLDANPDGWDARALANAAWGAAKLLQPRKYANPRERRAVQGSEVEEALKAACASLLRKIGDLAETRPDDFKAQELANVAWSFATADLDAPRLYASLATSATPRLAQFSAQELANVRPARKYAI
jgi:hypothetical protein